MIILTHLVQPARGAVIAFYCNECKRTTFMVDSLAVRPERGDYWLFTMCPDNILHGVQWKHNTHLQPAPRTQFVDPDPETILPSIY